MTATSLRMSTPHTRGEFETATVSDELARELKRLLGVAERVAATNHALAGRSRQQEWGQMELMDYPYLR
ncbi:MAG TPA: hypothetical protein VM537_06295 [Anaerolineae bacterium]|nr:hypothetical protein [Anaerolineae bacterium]